MTDKRDENGNLLSNDQRLTEFGDFLRKTSLDELPEIFLILTGKMSLIGPRPLHVEYLQYYNEEQRKRHNVRPGLTGWAQVNGRNSITWTEKFKLDVYYVENVSFLLDLKIIFLTIKQVICRKDIYSKEGNFVERFDGKN